MRRLVWLAALAAWAAGCASVPIRKAEADALIEADRRVLSGCYDCLIDARDTYERIGVGKARPFVINRLFEVQVLIALRERELGLDSSESMARAQKLAAELPTAGSQTEPAPPPLDGARILAMAATIPTDAFALPSLEYADFRRAQTSYLKGADNELDWLRTTAMSDAPREYLAMSFDCSYRTRGGRDQKSRPPGWKPQLPPDAPPLLQYRRAICSGIDLLELDPVRERVPRFVEISYFQARAKIGMLQQTGNVEEVRVPAVEFYERFPRSTAATFLRAQFHVVLGDCRGAMPYLEETIALRPAHELGLLNRVRCLSLEKRTDEAIAAATSMLALDTPQNALAYYWRAWNYHLLKRLPEARADITRAKRLLVISDTVTLAGIIEHDQDDLDVALKDLDTALSLAEGESNCEAQWYRGLVFMKKETWPEAAKSFHTVMGCYAIRRGGAENARRMMERRDQIDAEFKARSLANYDGIIEASRSQHTAAAYNAAHFYARAGSLDLARELLKVADTDPALAERVAELRKLMGGK